MTTKAFSHDIRALLCEQCGAPMSAPPQGGTATCGYCRTVHQVAPRVDRATLTPIHRAPMTEDARQQLLRRQVGRPMSEPAGLSSLLHHGRIEPHRLTEAIAVWQATRREVKLSGSPDAAERLLYLTLLLQSALMDDEERQRAVLESALDGLTLPRHRQLVLAALSRLAVRAGDLRAAHEWLAACDPRSEDLHADSAYRLAAAFLATARRDHPEVLAVLGDDAEDIPISTVVSTLAVVVRANAHERLGDDARAREQLLALMVDARARRAIPEIVRANSALDLCPTALPAATAAHDERAVRALGGSLGGVGWMAPLGLLMLIGAAVSVGLWLAAILPFEALPGIVGGLGITGFVFAGIGGGAILSGRRAARIRRHGRPEQAEVIEIAATGTKINDVRLVRVRMRVRVDDGEPYEATASVLESVLAGIGPGALIPVRIDPEDPSSVIIEAL